MKLVNTSLAGVVRVEIESAEDERGSFSRTFSRDVFAAAGLACEFAQCSTSYNTRAGTLRGMHFQAAPHAERKLVRCTAGSIFDVALDLRPESSTYLEWFACELSAANRDALYLPQGVAHGFQTLVDGAEVFYQIDVPYVPEAARGVRWNDPRFGIVWPLPNPILSARDAGFPDYVDPDHA